MYRVERIWAVISADWVSGSTWGEEIVKCSVFYFVERYMGMPQQILQTISIFMVTLSGRILATQSNKGLLRV